MVETNFKQTEIGLIPEDWDVIKVKNLASIKTGSRNTQDKVEYGLYPFFVRSQQIERINTYSFDGEAVLTAGDGVGVGKVMHYINGKFDCHQRVYRITNFTDEINGFYFYKYFSSNFYARIMQMTAKSSVDSVRMEMISDMSIPLPPTIEEQQAIATALSDADSWIESLEKLIAKKRLIKLGAMQELLTPKEDWEVKKLGDVFDISAGGDLSKYDYSDIKSTKYKYPVFSNSLSNKGLYCYSSDYSNEGQTITVTARGTVGFSNSRFEKYLAIGRLLVLTPRRQFSIFFFSEYINHKVQFSNESTGVPQLTAPQISKYEITFPTYNEQIRIANILSDMDAEIDVLEVKLKKAQQIKQGMMQQLLTGKIRLIKNTAAQPKEIVTAS